MQGAVRRSASSVSLQSLSRVSSRDALSRLSRVSSRDALCRFSNSICRNLLSRKNRSALRAITAKKCFARLNYIEELSVHDIAVIFDYAENADLVDFDRNKFLSEKSQIIRAIVTAMDLAVTLSRGAIAGGNKIKSRGNTGDIDALYFVAACRIFSEWRSLRLVPQGFKRHAVAMTLAHKDLLQNLKKIEDGVHSYLNFHASSFDDDDEPRPSPSLRQLLQHELDTKVHPRLPRLTENSASSGLLWVKRQMEYQETIFANALEVPSKYLTTTEAGLAAYTEVYGNYHGWAAKQVFQHSIGGSPDLEVLLQSMIPPKQFDGNHNSVPSRTLSDVSDSGRSCSSDDSDSLVVAAFDKITQEWDNLAEQVVQELDNFGKHISGEWHKAVTFLGRFNCAEIIDSHRHEANLIATSESHANILANSMEDSIVTQLNDPNKSNDTRVSVEKQLVTMKQDVAKHVEKVRPLLSALQHLIEELNMNDPTKV